MVSIERKYAEKVEQYLKNEFKCQTPISLDLVVFHEEDEDPMTVLKHLQQRIQNDLIVIEGNSLIEVPLDNILETHRFN